MASSVPSLDANDVDGEFRAEQLAHLTIGTLVLRDDSGDVISLAVESLGHRQNLPRAEFDAEAAAFTAFSEKKDATMWPARRARLHLSDGFCLRVHAIASEPSPLATAITSCDSEDRVGSLTDESFNPLCPHHGKRALGSDCPFLLQPPHESYQRFLLSANPLRGLFSPHDSPRREQVAIAVPYIGLPHSPPPAAFGFCAGGSQKRFCRAVGEGRGGVHCLGKCPDSGAKAPVPIRSVLLSAPVDDRLMLGRAGSFAGTLRDQALASVR
jgi:hypothetical protein